MNPLQTDLTSWTIGPYHEALPGPMRMRLKLDGEIIVSGSIETGFLHRGLEKTFELHTWQAAVAYADHLDPEGAVFGELALCLAVEEIAKIIVPDRAQYIRIIVAELSRVSCHLGYMARLAKAVGSETMLHYVLRDRERILDLLELLTGARFSLNFLRYGGVNADVTEGFIERVLEVCDLIRIRLKEYNDLFSYNHAFLKRTLGIGILTPDQALRLGVTGPNAKASGLVFDARKQYPVTKYGAVDFEVPVIQTGEVGDSHSRFLLRLREITQCIEILKQATESLPLGSFETQKVDKNFTVPPGEAYTRVENSRGLLGCHVVSDGSPKPSRVQFRTPSTASLAAIPFLIEGCRIEDLPVILSSLDLSIAEVDR